MIVSVNDLNQFTNNYEDSPSAVKMKTDMLNAAQNVVVQYLGYNPEEITRTEYLSGFGINVLEASAQPIKSIASLLVDGEPIDVETLKVDGSTIIWNRTFPHGFKNILVTYTAGYDPVPAEIHSTVLRIAALMLQESAGNIGLQSRSFGDTSRSFVNYTNYNNYLKVCEPYRTAIR